jgi:hypothetical protein
VPFTGDNFVAVAMQHINAPPPSVADTRPDVPPRVDAAVTRALSKDPLARFETMAAFCAELEACLADLRSTPDLAVTGVLPPVKQSHKQDHPAPAPRHRRRRRRLLALVVVAIAAAAIAAAVFVIQRDNDSGGGTGGGGSAAPLVPIHLTAVSAYDPDGDHHENDQMVPYATDGDPNTSWYTEHYRYGNGEMNKAGVGIILAAPASVKAREIIIDSSTPGYHALIESSDEKYGPFTPDSESAVGSSRTVFDLQGATARYYLIWITNLGPSNYVGISEVTGRS